MAEVQIIEVHLYELPWQPNQQYVFKGTFHPKKNDISIFPTGLCSHLCILIVE